MFRVTTISGTVSWSLGISNTIVISIVWLLIFTLLLLTILDFLGRLWLCEALSSFQRQVQFATLFASLWIILTNSSRRIWRYYLWFDTASTLSIHHKIENWKDWAAKLKMWIHKIYLKTRLQVDWKERIHLMSFVQSTPFITCPCRFLAAKIALFKRFLGFVIELMSWIYPAQNRSLTLDCDKR